MLNINWSHDFATQIIKLHLKSCCKVTYLVPLFWPRCLSVFLAFYPLTGRDAGYCLRRLRGAFQISKHISLFYCAVRSSTSCMNCCPGEACKDEIRRCTPALSALCSSVREGTAISQPHGPDASQHLLLQEFVNARHL